MTGKYKQHWGSPELKPDLQDVVPGENIANTSIHVHINSLILTLTGQNSLMFTAINTLKQGNQNIISQLYIMIKALRIVKSFSRLQ